MQKTAAYQIAMLTLALLGAGCARYDDPMSDSLPANGLPDAQRIAAKSAAHCEDAAQCSPSVAMLIGTEPRRVFQCTAFLVAPDILATNSHCIPEDLKTPGAACHDRLAAIFPGFGTYAETRVDCANVISASMIAEDTSRPDYAFIRLTATVDRPTLTITHEGMPDGGTYEIDRIDPYQGNHYPEGYLRRGQCHSLLGSLIASDSFDSRSPLTAIADCPVIHGNSGSPLLNARGEVTGIVFVTVDPTELGKQLDRPRGGITPRSMLEEPNLPPFGVATNYACLAVPGDGPGDGAQSPECTTPLPQEDPGETFQRKIRTAVEKRLEAKNYPLDASLRWKVTIVPNSAVTAPGSAAPKTEPRQEIALAVPDCLVDAAAFLATEPAAATSANHPHAGFRRVSLPAWAVRFKLNRYLQDDYRITEAPTAFEDDLSLAYDPVSIAAGQSSPLMLFDSTHLAAQKPILTDTLDACR